MSLDKLMTPAPADTQPISPANQVPTTDQQVTPPETAEKPQVSKQEDPLNFGRKFSALSRKEKELRDYKRQLEEERKQFEEQRKSFDPTNADFKRKLKLNPLEALKEAGVDLDYLTNVALSGGQVPNEVKISTDVEDLKAQIAALQARLEAKAEESNEVEEDVDPDDESNWTEEQKAAVQDFKHGMYEFLDQHNEKYPLIHEQEAGEAVYHVINELYKQSVAQGSPRIPSYEEGAQRTEQWLRSEVERLAGRVQNKPESNVQDSSKQVTSQASSQSTTLSNQLSTSRPTEASSSTILPREEALRRAAALLRTK
jgi:hypothetical protein